MNSFLKIGHRGHGIGSGENTLLLIDLGLRAGADGVEYDVRKTKDGKIVLIHDETVDRTTDGTGKVADYTYEELKRLNAGYREHVPLLVDALHQFNYCFHNIELKEPVGEEVLPIITKYLPRDQVLVSSFNWNALAVFALTNVPTAFLADGGKIRELGESGFVAVALARGAKALNINFSAITPSLVKLAHKHNLKVYAWTANERGDIMRMKQRGVDGIISDYPERL